MTDREVELAVDMFAAAMKIKLSSKGRERGNNDGFLPPSGENVRNLLCSHVQRLLNPAPENDTQQEVDIANLALMLWYQRIFPKGRP